MLFLRKMAKWVAYACGFILAAPISIPVRLLARFDRDDAIFQFGSQFFSLFPGIPGNYLRIGFYAVVLDCGYPWPAISFGTTFAQRGSRIGARTYIGGFCNFGLCDIGDDVLIGTGVHLASSKMHFYSRLDQPIRLQGGELQKIAVGDDCWIGNGAIIMGHVPTGSVVGAGSVLLEAQESYGIYAGSPARFIKKRG